MTLSKDFWRVSGEQAGVWGKGKAPEEGSVWRWGGEDGRGCGERSRGPQGILR